MRPSLDWESYVLTPIPAISAFASPMSLQAMPENVFLLSIADGI